MRALKWWGGAVAALFVVGLIGVLTEDPETRAERERGREEARLADQRAEQERERERVQIARQVNVRMRCERAIRAELHPYEVDFPTLGARVYSAGTRHRWQGTVRTQGREVVMECVVDGSGEASSPQELDANYTVASLRIIPPE